MDETSLCKYCLGCNALEDKNFKEKRNCKNFISGVTNYQELILKSLKDMKNKK